MKRSFHTGCERRKNWDIYCEDMKEASKLLENGKFHESKSKYDNCLVLNSQVYFSEYNIQRATIYFSLGCICDSLRDDLTALKYFEKSKQIFKYFYVDERNQKIADCYEKIGLIQLRSKNVSQSRDSIKRALDIRRERNPDSHEDLITNFESLALMYYENRDFLKSLKYRRKAVRIQLQIFFEDDLRIGESYTNIGVLYREMNDFSTSKKYFEKALRIQLQKLSKFDRRLAKTYSNIGVVCVSLGDALFCFLKSLEILLENYPDGNHPQIDTVYFNIGRTYEILGDLHAARAFFKKLKFTKKSKEHVNRVEKKMVKQHSNLRSTRKKRKTPRRRCSVPMNKKRKKRRTSSVSGNQNSTRRRRRRKIKKKNRRRFSLPMKRNSKVDRFDINTKL